MKQGWEQGGREGGIYYGSGRVWYCFLKIFKKKIKFIFVYFELIYF